MSVSVLITSNLDERIDWLKHRLKFLYALGHKGDVVVGIWGGHDKIEPLRAFCANLSPQITLLAQDGSHRITARLLGLAGVARGDFLVAQGDDDFLLPPSFTNAANLLATDPSVFCAQGRALSMAPEAKPPFMVGSYTLWQAAEHEVMPRFCGFTKRYSISWHALYRRQGFIDRMRVMDEVLASTSNNLFFESVGEFYSVIKGRFVILDEIYFIKGIHDLNAATVLRANLSDKMPPYLVTAPTFSADFKILEAKVFDLLRSEGVPVHEPEVTKQILDALIDYLGWVLFKRREPLEPAAEEMKRIAHQRPLHPTIGRVLDVVNATRPEAQR